MTFLTKSCSKPLFWQKSHPSFSSV